VDVSTVKPLAIAHGLARAVAIENDAPERRLDVVIDDGHGPA
jgi:hypothetical protein